MSIKMIASDLDGTLLGSGKDIPPENRAAIRRCAEKGVRIVFASGRSFESARGLALPLSHPVSLLCFNGGRGEESAFGPTLFQTHMDVDKAKAAWLYLKRTGEYFICYSGNCVFMGSDHPTPGHMHTPGRHGTEDYPQYYLVDDERFLSEGFRTCNKLVMFSNSDEKRAAARDYMLSIGLAVSSSWWDNIEIIPQGVNKGSGLLRLGALFGIAPREIMAAGDYLNDESMLSSAGYPVVMASGSDEIKKPGRLIAGSVAEAIRHYEEEGSL